MKVSSQYVWKYEKLNLYIKLLNIILGFYVNLL